MIPQTRTAGSLDGATKNLATGELRAKLALEFSRMLGVMATAGAVIFAVLWLSSGGHFPQFLALAAVTGLLAVSGWLYPRVSATSDPAVARTALLAFALAAFCLLPLLAPPLISLAAAAILLSALAGQVLLAPREGLRLTWAAMAGLVIDGFLAPALSSGLFGAALARELEQSAYAIWLLVPATLSFIWIGRRLLAGFSQGMTGENALLRLLIDNMPDRLFVKDQHSRMLVNNVAHAQILGHRSPAQVVGKTDFDFFAKDLAQKYFDDEQQVIRSGQSIFNVVEPSVDPEGHEQWLVTTKVLVRDAEGSVIGIAGISRDITEQRTVELERDRLHQLEQRQRADLEALVTQLRESAGRLTRATGLMLDSASQQAQRMAEQETEVERVMTSVEQVRAATVHTADQINAITASTEYSVSVARQGEQAVNETVQEMQGIQRQVLTIAETIAMLSKRSQQIAEIITTVNEIADQSEMLALNASIEAARAGAEGKGFAVVALEVRQLARQSRAATSQVSEILSEIEHATNAAVRVTGEGAQRTESGVQLVERAGHSIQELAATIEQAAQAVTQIAVSTGQQSHETERLVASMQQIRTAATRTTESVRQMEHGVHDLMAMAQQFEQSAEQYTRE